MAIKVLNNSKGEPYHISAEPCNCAEGHCEDSVLPISSCVNRLARKHKMFVKICKKCNAGTWHKDNLCLSCEENSNE